jgi:MFS family permease
VVDAARSKRSIVRGGLIAIIIAALLLAIWPNRLPVALALVLQGIAGSILTPAIAAISLQLVGHAALGDRLGRNARFASIGNGITAAVMGASGAWLSSRSVFWLTAALCVPALLALAAIGEAPAARSDAARLDWRGLRSLLTDRRLLIFAAGVLLFHLSNAAMLPLAAAAVTMRAGDFANLIIAACIVLPQGVVALCSPWVGHTADRVGRRPMLLLGWVALPLRGVLLAVLPGAYPVIAAQSISGISAAVFGVMLPLMAADLTRGTAHFTLCMGSLGLAVCVGAAISTSLAGWIADTLGLTAAFYALAAAGLLGTVLLWRLMPETRQA